MPMKRGGHGHMGDARDQDSLTIMWAHGAWVALKERAKGLVGRSSFWPMQSAKRAEDLSSLQGGFNFRA